MDVSIDAGIAVGAAVVVICVAMFRFARPRRDQPDMGFVSDRWIAQQRGVKTLDIP